MKEITKIMYEKYALNKLKYDFAGYIFQKPEQLSFHHLLIPKRLNGPQIIDNGAILVQSTSHNYLHIIEQYDYDMFIAITSEMVDENIKGYLDIENIKAIDDILNNFEKEYIGYKTKRGHELIKPEYIETRVMKL